MKFTRKIDNKLRGAYGETDLERGVIRINKARHQNKKYKRINPNKDGSEKLYGTIYHEETHAKHPKLTEREVLKREKHFVKSGSKKQKAKLYKLYNV